MRRLHFCCNILVWRGLQKPVRSKFTKKTENGVQQLTKMSTRSILKLFLSFWVWPVQISIFLSHSFMLSSILIYQYYIRINFIWISCFIVPHEIPNKNRLYVYNDTDMVSILVTKTVSVGLSVVPPAQQLGKNMQKVHQLQRTSTKFSDVTNGSEIWHTVHHKVDAVTSI